MSKFQTTDGLSADTTTRQTYKLTHGHGLSVAEREKIVHSLCTTPELNLKILYMVLYKPLPLLTLNVAFGRSRIRRYQHTFFIIISAFHF